MATAKKRSSQVIPAWGWRLFKFILAAAGYTVVVLLTPDLAPEQRHVLGVVVVAAILWFSEALPLFVTSLVVPVLLFFGSGLATDQIFSPFFDPIIGLFFGSFVLALALSKYKLDERAAALAFKYFGTSSKKLLFGLMAFVALVGMWLSNTATVAFMLPVFLLLIKNNRLEKRAPNVMKSFLLGLAFATSVDGLATIIGTPPNAIAVKFLADEGIIINFFDWMKFGIPILILLLPAVWFILTLVFPHEIKKLKPVKLVTKPLTRQQKGVLTIIGLTISLWVTQPLHGISSAIIALLGVLLLYAFSLLKARDLSRISWSTLLLFGGGLALGEAMRATGVTTVLADFMATAIGESSQALTMLALMLFAIAITTFASNTAIAAIVIPLVISLARTLNLDPAPLAIATTLALSVDVISPLGTPPSSMVYGTGKLRVPDFLRAGFAISAVGIGIIFVTLNIVF